MTKDHKGLSRDAIRCLEERVNALYAFRDNYFRDRPAEEALNKWEDVEAELKKVVMEAAEETGDADASERAFYLYLLGRALNVSQYYKPEAEEVLTRAVKLDAKLYQAWNQLGETYWKKGDLKEARACFLGALEHANNKESLRNLSILMRTKECWDLANGLRYAKESVEMDPKDGKSWLVLGNAYTSFYSAKQNPKILTMCKSAYAIAERDERLKNDPYLHFNRGIVERFQDDYASALESFQRAERLDPVWEEPQREKSKLLDYLEKAQSFVDDKGRLRGKKLKKLLKMINPGLHLGRSRNRKHVSLSELKPEGNKGKVVIGVVAATFQEESRFNVVLVDVHENAVVVNVYNLPEERGFLVGNVLAVTDPHVRTVRVAGPVRNYKFQSLRVEDPSTMVVNGKAVIGSTRSVYFTTSAVAD